MTESRFRISLEAALASPLHIAGPGRTVALVDRPIELDERGNPLIPASSIRGRIRFELERLLRTWGEPICKPPSPDQTCPHFWTAAEGSPPDLLCTACRIFGSAWYHSGLTNDNLILVDEQAHAADLVRMERTSVAIDRRLGTASAQRLFSSESTTAELNGEPLRFRGKMSGRLSDRELGWLLAAVRLVTHAGGSKSRGMGLLTLSALTVERWQAKAWHTVSDPNQLIEAVLDVTERVDVTEQVDVTKGLDDANN